VTQSPHDQLAKQYLEEFFTPLGLVERQYEIPGEAKYVDVWFVPDPTVLNVPTDLGLLGRIAAGKCLLEPYRNAPSRGEVRTSLLKLLWVQEDELRKAPSPKTKLPRLWVLAATITQPLLTATGAAPNPDWPSGVYFLPEIFRTAIVAIDQLPETEESLWLRILGRGKTQERAIREVLALPAETPRRETVMRLIASWKVRLDLRELADFIDQEEIMAFSEAFLTWEQETKNKGIQEGRQEGKQEGRQEGKQEERVEIAKNLLRQGLAVEAIAQATRLTLVELQGLQGQLDNTSSP
jgi:hypothetical protein